MAQEILNPNVKEVFTPIMEGTNLVQCNKSRDVSKFIKTGKKYVIELPDSNSILNVECTYAAINAADMKIKSVFINGEKDLDDEEYMFSYRYEHFDEIHYSSFAYREKCNIYISIEDLF
jgi:hypothetical protein